MSSDTKGHPAMVTLACDAEAVVASKPPAGFGIQAATFVNNIPQATTVSIVKMTQTTSSMDQQIEF